jgi:conjugative transfer region protein (TIGR03748 family)
MGVMSLMKVKVKFILITVLAVILVRPCLGNESVTQVGRYLTMLNKPQLSQIDLLSQTIQVRFPQNVQTIHEAMTYLLHFSGYDMIPITQMSKEFRLTLSKPLPIVDRELGPVSLRDGLIVLAGPAFILVEYPISREIDFCLKHGFQKVYLSNKGKKCL